MAEPTEYVAEGDGFDREFGPRDPIIRAAANGDIPEVRRQLSLRTLAIVDEILLRRSFPMGALRAWNDATTPLKRAGGN